MTERKPPDASWESWIERQIEEGRRDGAFDDLPGQGLPIDDLDRPHDDLWWVKAKMQREDAAVTPPTIAIRAERDAALGAAMSASNEAEVRELIESLNERIRDVNRFVTWARHPVSPRSTSTTSWLAGGTRDRRSYRGRRLRPKRRRPTRPPLEAGGS